MQYTAVAYFYFQFHTLACLDDVAMFDHENLTLHSQFDFVLKSKMRWLKNVLEKRNDPDKIIIGAMDPDFCAILSLAIHFEYSLEAGTVHKKTRMFGTRKGKVSDLLLRLFNEVDFPRTKPGKLGSHSNQKLPGQLLVVLLLNFSF